MVFYLNFVLLNLRNPDNLLITYAQTFSNIWFYFIFWG